MSRTIFRVCLLLPLALFAGGCGDDDPVVDNPTAPTPVQVTEPLITGTLSRNGAATSPFVANTGAITATLINLSPESSVVGFAIGEWNATTGLCQLRLTSDDATEGKVLLGAAQASANYCVRIYDATGNLAGPVAYEIEIKHY